MAPAPSVEPADDRLVEGVVPPTRQTTSSASPNARLGASRSASTAPVARAALLDAFVLDKAFYELRYELNNRPDWMILEAVRSEGGEGPRSDPTRGLSLIVLSIATSIDALAVGLSFAALGVQVWTPACVIGLTAGLMTLLGALGGRALGARLEEACRRRVARGALSEDEADRLLTAARADLPMRYSSLMRSKMITLASTAIPTVRMTPAKLGSVNVKPNTESTDTRKNRLSTRARSATTPAPV